MDMLELLAKLRQAGRKNGQFRKQGFIPAILYGHKIKNMTLLIKEQDFEKIYKEAGESTLIKLKISDDKDESSKKDRAVLIHEVAKDPVDDKAIHVDFQQVKMDKVTTVEVSLVFVGQSEAVDSESGVLIKSIQAVEVEALPQDLPHEIEVDISSLKTFDDSIYIKDLKLSDKVKVTANPDDVIASVIPPRTSAELEELEEVPAEAEEAEVEEKGRKEGGVEEGAEEPSAEESEAAEQKESDKEEPKEDNE